jgi:CDP-glucose 4,6-dehydratase
MHFFITGHTGFKGAWLTLLLRELGHEVSGYALPPVRGGLFERAGLESELKSHTIGDIRDFESFRLAATQSAADFVIHMAAQPLVLRSYEDPIETFTTNVDGTLNFLRVVSELKHVSVSLVVTTDKVYRDDGKSAYTETDPLGGHDPYSASKAMADILTQSWAANNPEMRLFIARAGNVIGAFDVSSNRLLPDLIRSLESSEELVVRNPRAVRPWQHVLDCLGGYLAYVSAGAEKIDVPTALNFGPGDSNVRSVEDVLRSATQAIPEIRFRLEQLPSQMKETSNLTLDTTLAEKTLDWKNKFDFDRAILMTLAQVKHFDALGLAKQQIREFISLNDVKWVT